MDGCMERLALSPYSFPPLTLSLSRSILPAMTTYSSSFREVGDNLVLARYQNTVEIPAAENSLIVSEYPIPGSETQKSTLRLTTTTPTTPEHQTVSFANVPRTQSPGSAKSSQSTSSVTYNSRMYRSELEAHT